MNGLIVWLVAVAWATSVVAVIIRLEHERRRPITPTDEALDRADIELDHLEAACRRRHPSDRRNPS